VSIQDAGGLTLAAFGTCRTSPLAGITPSRPRRSIAKIQNNPTCAGIAFKRLTPDAASQRFP